MLVTLTKNQSFLVSRIYVDLMIMIFKWYRLGLVGKFRKFWAVYGVKFPFRRVLILIAKQNMSRHVFGF